MAPHIYFDRYFQTEAAKILPGEYFCTAKDMLIVTVLGSCVAACIRDRVTGAGGMNHFMLPDMAKGSGEGIVSPSMRYGGYAMEVLINSLLKMGARRENLEAKVFGGGRVSPSVESACVGERNARFVKEFLRAEGISIVGEDLNGDHPRKVYFFPGRDKVLVKKLRELNNNTVMEREAGYVAHLRSTDVSGSIEIFKRGRK
jgi:chemotaxis protein CheD